MRQLSVAIMTIHMSVLSTLLEFMLVVLQRMLVHPHVIILPIVITTTMLVTTPI